jgi:hypothetical protein
LTGSEDLYQLRLITALLVAQKGGSLKRSLGMARRSTLYKAHLLITIGIIG